MAINICERVGIRTRNPIDMRTSREANTAAHNPAIVKVTTAWITVNMVAITEVDTAATSRNWSPGSKRALRRMTIGETMRRMSVIIVANTDMSVRPPLWPKINALVIWLMDMPEGWSPMVPLFEQISTAVLGRTQETYFHSRSLRSKYHIASVTKNMHWRTTIAAISIT